jgi:c-di-GMP-binding flagellar brake protein YcgR
VDLNAHKRITAITLAIPEQVQRTQRRNYFRVSVAGRTEIAVVFCEMMAGHTDRCAVDAAHFVGQMVNLSASGFCAVVPTRRRRGFHHGDRFFVMFSLPEIDTPFHLAAVVCHCRRIHDGADNLVGLRFSTSVAWPTKHFAEDITRFVASEERRQLKRGRKS